LEPKEAVNPQHVQDKAEYKEEQAQFFIPVVHRIGLPDEIEGKTKEHIDQQPGEDDIRIGRDEGGFAERGKPRRK
jgi:hypothetical protein